MAPAVGRFARPTARRVYHVFGVNVRAALMRAEANTDAQRRNTKRYSALGRTRDFHFGPFLDIRRGGF